MGRLLVCEEEAGPGAGLLGLLLGSTCQSTLWVWSVRIVLLGFENGRIGPVEKFLENNYFCFLPEVLHDYSKKFQKKKIDK